MPDVAPSWSIAGGQLDLTSGVLVGILNVTPDSFSDGGEHDQPESAIAHAEAMVAAGAHIVDVGGESTRPNADPVSLEEETRRAIPVVERLAQRGLTVSIDTYKPEMADLAVGAGAAIVNDVTGFSNAGMIEVVARSGAGAVIMHGRGQAVDDLPPAADVVGEVSAFLASRAEDLIAAGVDPSRIAVDPGLGFAKRHEQSVALLHGVDRLAERGFPVMIGASRKRFVGSLAGAESWDARDSVTAAITAFTFLRGARLFRVHDVAKSRSALDLVGAIVAND